ncbi:mRNA interferase HigB [compost metagenome]
MRVIARSPLVAFWEIHPPSQQPLVAWLKEAQEAKWMTPQDIKNHYPSASFVGNNRVVFNIGGNKYRLVVHIKYELSICYVRFIGTHADYNRIDVGTV